MPAVMLLLLIGAEPAAPDTVVVCPAAFRQALEPWVEHRTQQGRALAFVANTGSPEEIRRGIRDVAKRGRLRFVVLVGDAEPAMYTDPALRARCDSRALRQGQGQRALALAAAHRHRQLVRRSR